MRKPHPLRFLFGSGAPLAMIINAFEYLGKLLLGLFLLLNPLDILAQGYVIPNEVMAKNDNTPLPGQDPNYFPDWIELYNPSSVAVDLGNWMFAKSVPTWPYGFTNVFVFPSGVVMLPDEYLIVIYDNETNRPGIHTGYNLRASNGGEVLLLDPAGNLMPESVTFGRQIPDFSIGLDSEWHYYWEFTLPSPGQPNLPPVELGSIYSLKINEWMPTNGLGTHSYDDWFELYNPSTNPVMLSGLILTDTIPIPWYYPAISDLSFIEPRGFARFWAKGAWGRYDADEVGFKLSFGTGDTIAVVEVNNGSNNVIDQITFPGENTIPWVLTNYTTNINCASATSCVTNVITNYLFSSQGRLPDGSTNIVLFPSEFSTPGEANFLPLTNVVVTCSSNTVILTWSNVWAGTGFTVQFCDALLGTNAQASAWNNLTNVPPQETTGTRTVTDSISEGGKRFYRIVSPMQ